MSENDFWYVFVFHTFEFFENMKNNIVKDPTKKYKEIFRIYTKEAEDEKLNDLALKKIKKLQNKYITINEQMFAKLVYKNLKKKLEFNLGIELNEFVGRDWEEIYLRMRTCDHNLKVQAKHIKYKLQLNIEDNKEIPTKKEKYKDHNPYGHFSTEIDESVYKKNQHNSIFNFSDKVRILFSMINAAFDLSELHKMKLLDTHYPIPYKDDTNFKLLTSSKLPNIDYINEYYGEKIAMYFAWLKYYIIWLLIPSALGIISGTLYYASSSDKLDQSRMTLGEWSLFIFALLLSVCSTFMDQIWARRQSELAWKWGVADFYEVEDQRNEYKGEFKEDPVTGEWKKIDNKSKFFTKLTGFSISAFFVSLVVAAVLGLIVYKSTLTVSGNLVVARWVGIINAIQIKVFNVIYRYVAIELTNRENYETQTNYMNALIIRLFSFQFINSYISLFYIAFGKKYFEGCTNGDCLYDLTIQLTSIFFTHLFLNIVELGLPFIKKFIRKHSRDRKISLTVPKVKSQKESIEKSKEESKVGPNSRLENRPVEEIEKQLEKYDEPLSDYMEIVIDYGYIVLFGVAFPFSPLIALFLSVVELKVDIWKLCNLTRRPFPAKDGSIGIWMKVTQAMAVAGIVTNVAVLIFTSDVFDFESDEEKWFAFFIIEHALLLIKVLLSVSIPDRPQHMKDGLTWGNRLVDEKINKKDRKSRYSLPISNPGGSKDTKNEFQFAIPIVDEAIRITSIENRYSLFTPIPKEDIITLDRILK